MNIPTFEEIYTDNFEVVEFGENYIISKNKSDETYWLVEYFSSAPAEIHQVEPYEVTVTKFRCIV